MFYIQIVSSFTDNILRRQMSAYFFIL